MLFPVTLPNAGRFGLSRFVVRLISATGQTRRRAALFIMCYLAYSNEMPVVHRNVEYDEDQLGRSLRK
jgi:hypothetical protein